MRPPFQVMASNLIQLEEIAKSLANCTDLKDIRAIRDKAEAARHYAQTAALGFEVQNRAAELKLRAERRAGGLLTELVRHRGNRSSSSQRENLKLSELGIDHNQSSRWQREATVPQKEFEHYIATAKRLGKDISAQGLLRLERRLGTSRSSNRAFGTTVRHSVPAPVSDSVSGARNGILNHDRDEDSSKEIVSELLNHVSLLSELVEPICDRVDIPLKTLERRMIGRLLADIRRLLMHLEITSEN